MQGSNPRPLPCERKGRTLAETTTTPSEWSAAFVPTDQCACDTCKRYLDSYVALSHKMRTTVVSQVRFGSYGARCSVDAAPHAAVSGRDPHRV